jgi:exopolysaccharide production protein ExoQ
MIKKRIISLEHAEYIFVMFSLILYTEGIFHLFAIGGVSEGDAGASLAVNDSDKFLFAKILYPLTYIVAIFLLPKAIGKISQIFAILLKNISILLLLSLAIISTTWSELPEMTISRVVALIGTTIFGIYLANRYTLKEQIVLLGHTFFVIALLSIVFAVALPQYGIMGGIHDGAWRGIYCHKNQFGRLMTLSTIVFLMQPKQEAKKLRSLSRKKSQAQASLRMRRMNLFQTLFKYLGLILSLALLVLSRSSGAIVNLTILTVLLAIFKIGRLRYDRKFIAIIGGIVTLSILVTIFAPNPEAIFTTMGKSSDLTGRGDLWTILIDMLWKNTLFGFGYGAFWAKYGSVVALDAGWAAPDAHNGFIDLTLSVGLVGLGLFALGYFYTLFKCLARFFDRHNDEQLYQSIVLVFIAISNFSETGLFTCNHIFWLLYVTISFSNIPQVEATKLLLPEKIPTRDPILPLSSTRERDRPIENYRS